MGTIRGMDCKLYFNSGSFGTPTWAVVDAVENANYEISWAEISSNRRGNSGWETSEPGLRSARLNVTFIKDKDDATFELLRAAAEAEPPTAVELVAYDGASGAGSDGLDAMWRPLQWNEGQEIDGVVKIEAVYAPVSTDANIPNPLFLSGTLPASRP